MRILLLLSLLPVILLSGCASIVNGQTQVLSVKTILKGEDVDKCACALVNNKGTWFITSPGTVSVHRSYQDLQVSCKKDGLPTGMMAVKSSTKGMAFGNILFGGIIGAGVDAGTGAAYDYPTLITVAMGETAVSPAIPDKPPVAETRKPPESAATPDVPPK